MCLRRARRSDTGRAGRGGAGRSLSSGVALGARAKLAGGAAHQRAPARARAGRRGRSRVDVAAARPRPPVLCCSDGAGAAARRPGGRRAPRFLPRRGGGVARSARAQAGNLSCDNCAVSGRCVLQMNYWGSTFSAGSATWRVSRSSSDWLVAWHTLRAGSTLASIVSYGLGRPVDFLSRAGATARGRVDGVRRLGPWWDRRVVVDGARPHAVSTLAR